MYADLASLTDSLASLSPDGDQVLFGSLGDDGPQIHVRSLRTGAVRTINVLVPYPNNGFWARDSRSFYYSADGKLMHRTIGANTSVVLGDLSTLGGGCEEEDGSLLLAGPIGTPILVVPVGDFAPTSATDEPHVHGESLARSPVCLPGTDRFLYLAREAPGVGSSVYFAGAGAPRKFVADADALVGVSRGHLLYVRNSVLHAQRLNVAAEQVLGPVLRVVDHVDYIPGMGNAAVSLSASGAMTYRNSVARKVQFSLYSLDGRRLRDIGEPIAVVGEPASLPRHCVLSHDRLRFACHVANPSRGSSDIWVINVASGVRTPLTDDAAPKLWPTWDRDNHTVYYVADRHGFMDIYSRQYDSAAPEREVLRSERDKLPLFSPAPGRLWWRHSPDPEKLLHEMASDGESKAQANRGMLLMGVLSPDNRFVAFHSDNLEHSKVLVGTFPDTDRRRIVYPRDAFAPTFGPDNSLYFWTYDVGVLHRVTIGLQGTELLVSEPTPTQVTLSDNTVVVGLTSDSDVIVGRALPFERRPTRYVSDWTTLLAQ